MGDEVVHGGKGRPVQKRRIRSDAFGVRKRARFLNHLAATCNVKAAARAAEVASISVYRARRRDPAFARAWQLALAEGYARLEEALLAKALAPLSEEIDPAFDMAPDPEQPGNAAPREEGAVAGDSAGKSARGTSMAEAGVDVKLAAFLLSRHAGLAAGKPEARRGRVPVATQAETDAVLMRKLAILKRQMAKRADEA